MMKKTLIATAMLATTSTAALAEISGNVALSTDYVWRGFSQTDNQMAISGGLDFAHESGFYLGTWASNVESSGFSNSSDPQIELDVYGGFGGEMNGFSYDIGFIEYLYPGDDDDNETLELYAGAGMSLTDSVSGGLKFYYSDEFFGDESAWRVELSGDVALPQDFGMSLVVGHNDGDAFDSGFDYVDYSVGLSKSVAGVDLGLTYTDSDADGCGNICDGRVVFSVGKSL